MTARWPLLYLAAMLVMLALQALTAGTAARLSTQVERLRANEATLAQRCVFDPAGGAVCPAGSFHVDRVKAAK